MMQDKIEALCEMAKKAGCSDKTVEMMKSDLMGSSSKDGVTKLMPEDSKDAEAEVESSSSGGTKIEVETVGKPSKESIKKALEVLTNTLGI